MALINRIEIANYLDKRQRKKWSPNFRLMVLNLAGRNTAIRLTNGQGKTSLANAVYLLLTRHKGLAEKVKEIMSPSGVTAYSHIRIEIVDGEPTGDLLSAAGLEVQGERWVFGVCGHRDGELNFYYYPGCLEDCPVGVKYPNGTIELFDNQKFRSIRSKLGNKLRWKVSKPDYREQIETHFAPGAFNIGLDCHLRGGADHGADFFKVEGHRKDKDLFFRYIAPQLLAGAGNPEDLDSDEYFFENTVLKSAQKYAKARIVAEQRRAGFEKLDKAFEFSKDLCKTARDGQGLVSRVNEARKGVEADLVLLKQVVENNEITGIPERSFPEGLLGELVKGIVVDPSEGAVCILDRTLQLLVSDQSPSRINQFAQRQGILAFPEKPEMVRFPNLDIGNKRGRRGQAYAIEEAKAIFLQGEYKFVEGLSREDALQTLIEAFKWWREECDTNLHRVNLIRMQGEVTDKKNRIKELSGQIRSAQMKLEEVNSQLDSIQEGKSAWERMERSKLFSPEELDNPIRTGGAVESIFKECQSALDKHNQKTARLQEWASAWDRFKEKFPEESPKAVKDRLDREYSDLRGKEEDAIKKARDLVSKLKGCQKKKETTSEELRKIEAKVNCFISLDDGNRLFLEIFNDEAVEGLKKKVLDHVKDLRDRREKEKELLARLSGQLEKVLLFQKKFPGEDADVVRKKQAAIVRTLNERKVSTEKGLEDAHLALAELENNQLAPSPIARKALAAVEAMNPRTVHEVISTLSLSSERKTGVLANLSAVLFAPVLMTPEQAGKAAKVLEGKQIPVPVFAQGPLLEYARTGEWVSLNEGQIVHTYQVGVRTLNVDTIVSPEKIKVLIEQAKEKVKELSADLELINQNFGAEKKALELVESSINAIKKNVPGRCETARKEIQQVERQLPEAERRASAEALGAIKARDEFLKLGGDQQRNVLNEKLLAFQNLLDEGNQELGRMEEAEGLARKEQQVARNRLKDFESRYPREFWGSLDNAQKFKDNGGVEFMATTKSVQKSLEDARNKADCKRKHDFERAQIFIDNTQGDLERLVSDKNYFSQKIKEWSEAQQEADAQVESLEVKLKKFSECRKYLDTLVALVLNHYEQKVPLLGEKLQNNFHPFETLCKIMADQSTMPRVFNKLKSAAGSVEPRYLRLVQGDLSSCLEDVDEKTSALAKVQKELDSVQRRFTEAKETYFKISGEGLSAVERRLINEGEDNFQEVLDVFNDLEELVKIERQEVEKLEDGVRNVTAYANQRLTGMVGVATDNLRTLRSVMRRTPQATFDVQCAIVSDKETLALMTELLNFVDAETRHFEENAKRFGWEGKLRENKDKATKKSLVEQIRESVYKGIFKEVSVSVIHPSVRDGQPVPYGSKISGGEAQAVSLMFLSKLQEFTMVREDKRLAFSSQRRRSKASRVQSVMLLDGLFSNLSDKAIIQSAMEGYKATRGFFQIIGLIHNHLYENDYEVFPNFISLKALQSSDGEGGFICFADDQKPVTPESLGREIGELEPMQFSYLKKPSVLEETTS